MVWGSGMTLTEFVAIIASFSVGTLFGLWVAYPVSTPAHAHLEEK